MIGDLATVLARIGPDDRVLDLGGGLRPLSRADVVVDSNPIDNLIAPIGDGPPRFSADSWLVHDVNDKRGLPFADRQFDFVFCSHLLEDIRDPVFVCEEIRRVGKRGYIETPSRSHESTLGVQSSYFAGYMHHRWFVEEQDGGLVFTFKSPLVHEHAILQCHDSGLPTFLPFFWDGGFACREHLMYHPDDLIENLIAAAARWQTRVPADRFREIALGMTLPHRFPRRLPQRARSRVARTLLSLRNTLSAAG